MKIQRLAVFLLPVFLLGCSSATKNSAARDNEGLTPLHRAAGEGNVALMEELIRDGADVNALDSKMGVDVLHKAVYSGNPEAVRLLLEKGALVDVQSFSNGDTAIHDAIYFKKKSHGKELIDVLLQFHASLSIRNRAGFTPLGAAVLLKDDETIRQIHEEEAKRFSSRGHALMEAVRNDKLDIAKRLLADPSTPINEADDQGFTPLLWAAREGMVKMTELLLDHGADPNRLDSWMGANAGHKAAFWGRTEVMRLLVKRGLDLNARGLYNGYTALHDAVNGSHIETAQVLVDAGARINIRGHDGKTALDLAQENQNAELVELLTLRINVKK